MHTQLTLKLYFRKEHLNMHAQTICTLCHLCESEYILINRGNIINDVLNVFIDIQTSKEFIQMDTDKMMTYGTFTMDDEKLTQS